MPALYDQSIGEFYFVGGPISAQPPMTPPPSRAQTQGEIEADFWDRIKDSPDPKDFADYLHSFPQGPHSATASLLARRLQGPASGLPGAAFHDTEVRVDSVSSSRGALTVTVVNAPEGSASISVNGTRFDSRNQIEHRSPYMTLYRLEAAPKELNLHIGDNQISVQYPDLKLPEYRFWYSETEMQSADARARLRSTDPQVRSVNPIADRLRVTVAHAPEGTPVFLVNGRPTAGELVSQIVFGDLTSYTYRGSPARLNIHSGDNEIAVRYQGFTTAAYSFVLTEYQLAIQMMNRNPTSR